VEFVSGYTAPVWRAAYPTLAPVVDPLAHYGGAAYNFCADMLHRDLSTPHPDDIVVDENKIPGMGQDDSAAATDEEDEDEEEEEQDGGKEAKATPTPTPAAAETAAETATPATAAADEQ
jgi:hypothetical protein